MDTRKYRQQAQESAPDQGEQPKKNRFQSSREVQQDFVNEVARNMLTLAEMGGKNWQKPWGREPVRFWVAGAPGSIRWKNPGGCRCTGRWAASGACGYTMQTAGRWWNGRKMLWDFTCHYPDFCLY